MTTSNVFTAFLDRHNSEIIEKFDEYFITKLAPIEPARAKEITTTVVQFFLGRILGTLPLESDLAQEVIRGTLNSKISQERMRTYVDKFFEILDELSASDSALSKSEQAHIQRVLAQSHKFLLIDLFSIKPNNLKKD